MKTLTSLSWCGFFTVLRTLPLFASFIWRTTLLLRQWKWLVVPLFFTCDFSRFFFSILFHNDLCCPYVIVEVRNLIRQQVHFFQRLEAIETMMAYIAHNMDENEELLVGLKREGVRLLLPKSWLKMVFACWGKSRKRRKHPKLRLAAWLRRMWLLRSRKGRLKRRLSSWEWSYKTFGKGLPLKRMI